MNWHIFVLRKISDFDIFFVKYSMCLVLVFIKSDVSVKNAAIKEKEASKLFIV